MFPWQSSGGTRRGMKCPDTRLSSASKSETLPRSNRWWGWSVWGRGWIAFPTTAGTRDRLHVRCPDIHFVRRPDWWMPGIYRWPNIMVSCADSNPNWREEVRKDLFDDEDDEIAASPRESERETATPQKLTLMNITTRNSSNQLSRQFHRQLGLQSSWKALSSTMDTKNFLWQSVKSMTYYMKSSFELRNIKKI